MFFKFIQFLTWLLLAINILFFLPIGYSVFIGGGTPLGDGTGNDDIVTAMIVLSIVVTLLASLVLRKMMHDGAN